MLTTSLVLLATRRVLRSPVILSNTRSTDQPCEFNVSWSRKYICAGSEHIRVECIDYMLDMWNCANHATFPTCSSNLSHASPLALVSRSRSRLGSLWANPRLVVWSCPRWHVCCTPMHITNHTHKMRDRHTLSRKARRYHSTHLHMYCTFTK